jgi:hypothetical protein
LIYSVKIATPPYIAKATGPAANQNFTFLLPQIKTCAIFKACIKIIAKKEHHCHSLCCKNLVYQTFQTDQDKKQALLEAEQEKLRGKKKTCKNKFKNSAENWR